MVKQKQQYHNNNGYDIAGLEKSIARQTEVERRRMFFFATSTFLILRAGTLLLVSGLLFQKYANALNSEQELLQSSTANLDRVNDALISGYRPMYIIQFEEWLRKSGANIDNLELSIFPHKNNQRGWRTLRTKEVGALNILLPYDLIISTGYFLSQNYGKQLEQFIYDYKPAFPKDPTMLFVAGLIIERTKGKASKWYPYFNLFRNDTFKSMAAHPQSTMNLELLS